MVYDLAVIGGGAAGCRAADSASLRGLSVILFEKKKLGGPLADGFFSLGMLLDEVALSERAGRYLGQTPRPVDHAQAASRVLSQIVAAREAMTARLSGHGVTVVHERASILGRRSRLFLLQSGEQTEVARRVLLCTGSMPELPEFPGAAAAAETGFFDPFGALLTERLPASVVIVGAGVRGLQIATYLNAVGVRVSLVGLGGARPSAPDEEIVMDWTSALVARGVSLHADARIVSCGAGRVTCEGYNGVFALECDHVILPEATRPALRGLGLELLGQPLTGGGLTCAPSGRTVIPDLYLAGEADGVSFSALGARRAAEICVGGMLGRQLAMRQDTVPGGVPVFGELGWVGRPSGRLMTQMPPAAQLRLPLPETDGFSDGWCKLLGDRKTGRLLGAHMRGPGAAQGARLLSAVMEADEEAEQARRLLDQETAMCQTVREALGRLFTAVNYTGVV